MMRERIVLKKLFVLVNQINKKLEKLDTIETRLAAVDHDIAELKESYTFVHNTADDLKREQDAHTTLILNQGAKVKQLELTTSGLQQDLTDLRARSMRNNLLF